MAKNKISLAMSGGIKVLNPTPSDVRDRVTNLSDILNDPTYYVGYPNILEESSGNRFYVESGSAVGGWTFGIESTSGTDKNFIWEQNSASTLWTVIHNLEKKPSVIVIDSAGTEVIGHTQYISDTELTITFSAAFKGKAILN